MSDPSLLPANASALERAIALASNPLARLADHAEAIRRFKTEPGDPVVPYLVWEYALEELLPYLPDPRRAIREGVLWQRIRGTPRALAVALSWIGARDTLIEQEEAGGAHWAEYQFDPGRVLLDEEVARFVAVARLSAPARSRLSRIYHGFDRRRVQLDTSRLDEALLSDTSGIFWQDGQTKLSFGRVRKFAPLSIVGTVRLTREVARFIAARYPDRCLLDEMRFGCRSPGNPRFDAAHLWERRIVAAIGRAAVLPERRFAKAEIVLSEAWPLGDTNACTPVAVWVGDSVYRFGDPLSSGIGRGHWVAITERLERALQAMLAIDSAVVTRGASRARSARLLARRVALLSHMRLSEARGAYDRIGRTAQVVHQAVRPEQPATTRPERRFAKAEIVLSEAWPLGDTNARTPMTAWTVTLACARLSEMRLDDAAIVVRTPIEEAIDTRHERPVMIPVSLTARHSLVTTHAQSLTAPLPRPAPSAAAFHSHACAYAGQRWVGGWGRASWTTAREFIESQHTTEVL